MKNSKKLNALLIAAMISVPSLYAQELKSSGDDEMEGKMNVVIMKDDNGKVEEYKREFNLEDQEEMEKFLEEKGVELKFQEIHENAMKDGQKVRMKVIKEIEDDGSGEEEKVMIMRFDSASDEDVDFEQNFEFNWVSDSSNSQHKVFEFKHPHNGEMSKNVFIFDDEMLEGDSVVFTHSYVFIKREPTDDDSFGTGITEERLSDMPIENLKMYPNPNDGNFSSEFSVTEPSDILMTITDSKGAIIYEKELNNFSGNYKENVDLSKEKSGLYFYNLKIGDKMETNKIILQ